MPRQITVQGSTATVFLTQGKISTIDAADVERVREHNWATIEVTPGYYYARNASAGYLHRFLTHAPKGKVVDHLNGDTLDNRQANLRIVTQHENALNRRLANSNSATGIRGVHIQHVPYKDHVNTYYNARVMKHGKSKTKNFNLFITV